MATAILLRTDYDAQSLRALARRSRDARQVRRLLALAAAYEGAARAEAAAVGGMDRQTLRDWAVRFNAEGPDSRDCQEFRVWAERLNMLRPSPL